MGYPSGRVLIMLVFLASHEIDGYIINPQIIPKGLEPPMARFRSSQPIIDATIDLEPIHDYSNFHHGKKPNDDVAAPSSYYYKRTPFDAFPRTKGDSTRTSNASPFPINVMKLGRTVTTMVSTAATVLLTLAFVRFVLPFILSSSFLLLPLFLFVGAFSRPYSRDRNSGNYYEVWLPGIPAREEMFR